MPIMPASCPTRRCCGWSGSVNPVGPGAASVAGAWRSKAAKQKGPAPKWGRAFDPDKSAQKENVLVTNHSWTGFTRTDAQVLLSGCTEIGMSPSSANALRMFS
jgi:hypothetical protein